MVAQILAWGVAILGLGPLPATASVVPLGISEMAPRDLYLPPEAILMMPQALTPPSVGGLDATIE